MPRTDKQIAEYMAYYRGTIERKAALEALARVEHKTPAEILAICAKINGKDNNTMQAISKETRDAVISERKKGVPREEVARKHDLTVQQVSNLVSWEKKRQREQEKNESASFPKETYPGQIEGELKYDEHELEFEKHIDELEARRETLRPETPRTNEDFETEAATGKSGVWYALLAQLEEFAVGTFGKGTVFDSGAASSEKKIARLGVLTPDRKKVQITIEELGE